MQHAMITVVLPLILHVHACRRCAIKPSNNRALLLEYYLGQYNVGQNKKKKAKIIQKKQNKHGSELLHTPVCRSS